MDVSGQIQIFSFVGIQLAAAMISLYLIARSIGVRAWLRRPVTVLVESTTNRWLAGILSQIFTIIGVFTLFSEPREGENAMTYIHLVLSSSMFMSMGASAGIIIIFGTIDE